MASASDIRPELVANSSTSSSKKRKLGEDTPSSRTINGRTSPEQRFGQVAPKSAATNTFQRPGDSLDGGSGSDDSSTEFDDARATGGNSKKGKSTISNRREGGKPVRKYASACQFCRRRKMKCDTVRPSCTNCIEHGEACNYERQTKPRPTHAVIHGLQDEVNQLRQLLQAKQRESLVLESKSELAGQDTTVKQQVVAPETSSTRQAASLSLSPYSPIRALRPMTTPKEEDVALPNMARPSLKGHSSSDKLLSVSELRQSPGSTKSKVGFQDFNSSGTIHQGLDSGTVHRTITDNASLDTSTRLTLDMDSKANMVSERASPEPETDDVGPANSSWGRSPLLEGGPGSSGGGQVDVVKQEQEGKPEFRLPSDSHLRSHLEKMERGVRQRRESNAAGMTMTTAVAVSGYEMEEMNADDLIRQNELMARAAQARHRERIDFSTGSLDCNKLLLNAVRRVQCQKHTIRRLTERFYPSQILYGVSKYSDRQELRLHNLRGGLGFLDRAKTLLGQDLHEPSVPTIQALLLLANSLGAQGIAGNGALYHTSTIILHRPFVESTEEFFSDSTSTTASWSACVAAAVAFTQCLRLYRQIFTIRRAPYLISYATYVASTIHVRAVAAENAMMNKVRGAESTVPGTGPGNGADSSDATKALKLCWDALVEAGKVNHGCRKAQNIIAGLMEKLDVSIGTPQQVKDAKLPDGT
ncbi:hypothetical protein QFC19_003569 [Naganishia cerealis]|uniref:Uncharacterized protein n=1 Tax=Naganishia cerealis TaxID=610337 RepID=A0ACC2W4N8_9TREE|nr:hypothetical protein QFC19_003569 [Naganishia cerealis]